MAMKLIAGTTIFVILLIFPWYAFAQNAGSVEEVEIGIPDTWSAALTRVPENAQADVIEAFELAGSNSDALVNTLLSVPDTWIPGAVFLIRYMPVEDLTVITEQMFTDNLRCAYEVRATYPWCSEYDEETFLHYVLPMRVSQEPLENWRPYFLENLKPYLSEATNLDDAREATGQWIWSLASFQQTQNRDQGPFETISGGYGRCEELMSLFIDGLRASGIPARHAWTPYWTYQDNNHAWTEYLGGDMAWHCSDGWVPACAQRTAIVLSSSFGLMDEGQGNIYRNFDVPGARYSIIDSIGDYRDECNLTVKVVDINGNPKPETDVYISIWNYGALRPIATGTTDENGEWKISIGPGGLFISAGDEISGALEVLQLPEVAEYELELRLGIGAEVPPETFWLRYPNEGEAQ